MSETGTTPERAAGDWQLLPMLDDVWQVERVRRQLPVRSVAVRLTDGRLAVWSPIKGVGAAGHRALAARGRPAFLVAPNYFHHLGLAEYAAAHAPVTIVSAAAAAPRVARQCGLRIAGEDSLRASLPPHISLLVPPGTRSGEMWLSVAGPRGRAWIVGDGFFNIARTPISPIGVILRLFGTMPGLRVGTTFRVLVRDAAVYRTWVLDKIRSERPTILVPCHGEILADADLPGRLERLVAKRFQKR